MSDAQIEEDMWKARRWIEERGVGFQNDSKLPTAGRWNGDPTIIFINPEKEVTAYVVLHEYGHILNGYGCCREHDEFKAHGSAVAIARILEIDLGETYIENYVGWSACCPIRGLPNNGMTTGDVLVHQHEIMGDHLNVTPGDGDQW